MDDESTFGVELYRKSYLEAVRNGWLSDYRIIAMAINDREAFEAANLLAKNTQSKGRRKLTTTDYLRGLAFALTMGGGTQGEEVDIKSCIAFMNTVDKSKNMASDLQTDRVKKWVSRWLDENANGQPLANYSLEHLDASSNAAAREIAKNRLAEADTANPHGIINVGIFGEGTDSPSLSAVAFLEERKSPIDVIQAVGRAMRTSPGKKLGYIVCPILISPTADPKAGSAAAVRKKGGRSWVRYSSRCVLTTSVSRQPRGPPIPLHTQAPARGAHHSSRRHRGRPPYPVPPARRCPRRSC